jgi:hypothetical protein
MSGTGEEAELLIGVERSSDGAALIRRGAARAASSTTAGKERDED